MDEYQFVWEDCSDHDHDDCPNPACMCECHDEVFSFDEDGEYEVG